MGKAEQEIFIDKDSLGLKNKTKYRPTGRQGNKMINAFYCGQSN